MLIYSHEVFNFLATFKFKILKNLVALRGYFNYQVFVSYNDESLRESYVIEHCNDD